MKADQLLVFKYEDQGVATLEDGLYALEKSVADAKTADKLARLLKASLKGWDYAIKHQDEAVKIVLDNDASGAQKKDHQTRMMGEIAKLVEGGKLGGGVFTTDDLRRDYEEMSAKGVKFAAPPKEEIYGFATVFQDDSGNFFSFNEEK